MRRTDQRRHCSGFSYVLMLFVVALLSLGLALAAPIYSHQVRREREAELIRIGTAYVKAIRDFYEASPGSSKTYPKRIEDLLEDNRFVQARRHLRKRYRDPIARTDDWGVVLAPDGGIAGVYSRSTDKPLIERAIVIDQIAVGPATRYEELKFVYRPAGSAPRQN